MEEAVRGDRRSAVGSRDAVAIAESAACLLDDRLNGGEVPELDPDRVDGAVDGSLGHEHVGPEVTVPPCVPRRGGERRNRLFDREREHGVLDVPHCRDVDAIAVRPGAAAALGMPAAVECGSRDDTQAQLTVLLEGDQGRPDGDAARVVAGAVDRVDDPAAPAPAGDPELLAEHAVARALGRESLADRRLDRSVGLRDRGQVGLRLDVQVARAKTAERDGIGRVGERESESKVGAHASPDLSRPSTSRRRRA